MCFLALLLPLLALPPSSDRGVVSSSQAGVVHVSVRFLRQQGPGAEPLAVTVQRPGSGVVLSAEGLVVTNAHLVEGVPVGEGGADQQFWPVVVDSRGRPYQAHLVALDERRDLALLQLEMEGETLTPLTLSSPSILAAGTRVFAASRAHGTDLHVFAGVLGLASGPVRLREGLLGAGEILISDARFHPTLDGGPLLDSGGRVIGLHNSSHISPLPPGFGGEVDSGDPENQDYAVILSAGAIVDAFPGHIGRGQVSTVPLGSTSPGVDAVGAILPCLVSVSSGVGPPPELPDPGDPHCLRLSEGVGSGVVIGEDGLIVTAAALLRGGDGQASVRMGTGRVLKGEVLLVEGDVALIRVSLPEGVDLSVADTSRVDPPIQGEPVYVVGRPIAGGGTVSAGVLSAGERGGRIQVASWVHPGHHGGALVDQQGRLLGLPVPLPDRGKGVSSDSYLGFAVPLAIMREALKPYWPDSEGASPTAALEPGPVSQVVKRTHGALVNVIVSREAPREDQGFNPFGADEEEVAFIPLGQGSGVIIDGGGLALTNWHVVDAALADDGSQDSRHRVEVTTQDGRSMLATVLSTSRDDDLALLAVVVPTGQRLHTVELGDSSRLRLGDPVVAIGNPLGLANSVSAGLVSALDQDVQINGRLRAYSGMIQTDAAINPGNSGGALLDLKGRLVGINSAGRTGAGMAISVNRARQVFRDKLLSAERMRSSYIGLEIRTEGDQLHAATVDPHGPAAGAGVAPGDRLLSLGGRELDSEITFAQALLSLEPWSPTELVVLREDREEQLKIVPTSFAAYRAFRQSGVLVEPIGTGSHQALVRKGSLALHRAYTGADAGGPQVHMEGVLRVMHVQAPEDGTLALSPGDLILGIEMFQPGRSIDTYELVRFEGVDDLGRAFDAAVGREVTCWVYTEGVMRRVSIALQGYR